jgi:Cytochrome c554 and c-prime
VVAPSRSAARIFGGAVALVLVLIVVGYQAAYARRVDDESRRHRPDQVLEDDYVSSAECRSCHPSQYQSWSRSYHRTMTQVATPATVFGEFDGRELSGYRVSREGERFFVDVPDRSGRSERKPISLVTGSHHMQIYWFESGESRTLGQLPFAYLKADQRWVPRRSVFLEPPGDMRPTENGRWNNSCLACHTTHARPRGDAQGQFDTHVAELGIACEACHGPGRPHVEKQASPLARYQSHFGGSKDSRIVNPGKLDNKRASEICSQCHALWQHKGNAGARAWNEHGFTYRPGGDPTESMWLLQPSQASSNQTVAWVMKNHGDYVDGQFWRDGAARVSGREYSGMIDSPCYAKGEISCLSCHSMHKPADDKRPFEAWANDQLAKGMDGDQGCLQCHKSLASDVTQHTKHAASSSGSRCYNCHMPYTSYGLLTAMRSHRIDVPNVRATLDTGRPNACTSCHLDKSLGWAADQLQAQYGIQAPSLSDDERNVEHSLLLAMTGDAGQRALVAWAAGWPDAVAASPAAPLPALLGQLMEDPYDAVRYIAERSLRRSPSVNSRDLVYDFVATPNPRAGVAAEVAQRAVSQPPAAEAERVAGLIARLKPLRNHRRVQLLE